MMSNMPAPACKFNVSFQSTTLNIAVNAVPSPAHIAYAIPSGNIVSVFENAKKQPAIPITNAALGINREKPSDNFIICVENTSNPIDKNNIAIDSYDHAQRQVPAVDPSIDPKNGFRDPRLTLTEEQVKIETSRCLGCGATIVDANKCIGCGLCTTRCEFDAIHLLRDHPQNSDMRRAEDKVGGLATYAIPRAVKILLHSGSEEAKIMRKKRKEYNKATKEFHKTHPHTGNAVNVEDLMKD